MVQADLREHAVRVVGPSGFGVGGVLGGEGDSPDAVGRSGWDRADSGKLLNFNVDDELGASKESNMVGLEQEITGLY